MKSRTLKWVLLLGGIAVIIGATWIWWNHHKQDKQEERRSGVFKGVMSTLVAAEINEFADKQQADILDRRLLHHALFLNSDAFDQDMVENLSRLKTLESDFKAKSYRTIPGVAIEGYLESLRLLNRIPKPKGDEDTRERLLEEYRLAQNVLFQTVAFEVAVAACAGGAPKDLRASTIMLLRDARERESTQFNKSTLEMLDDLIQHAEGLAAGREKAEIYQEKIKKILPGEK
jgi:hypothetical protein